METKENIETPKELNETKEINDTKKQKTSKPKKNIKKSVKRKKKKKPLTIIDKFKIEVAKELGLWEKVKKVGWAGLSAAETGQIGGYMTRKMREKRLNNLTEYEEKRARRKRPASSQIQQNVE